VIASVMDYIVWFSKRKELVKYRQIYREKVLGEEGTTQYVSYRNREALSDHRLESTKTEVARADVFASDNLTSPTAAETTTFEVTAEGAAFIPK
jgi:adenine-specific DNA-methyltransferase